MGQSSKFQATVWQLMQEYRDNSDDVLWQNVAFDALIANIENAKKSLRVLQKHLPERFFPYIRFAQPKQIWYLNVEKSLTAHQLNGLLDDLSLRIARDIGYAPQLRVMVNPSHEAWRRSGFPLSYPVYEKEPLPDEKEARKILQDFINQS